MTNVGYFFGNISLSALYAERALNLKLKVHQVYKVETIKCNGIEYIHDDYALKKTSSSIKQSYYSNIKIKQRQFAPSSCFGCLQFSEYTNTNIFIDQNNVTFVKNMWSTVFSKNLMLISFTNYCDLWTINKSVCTLIRYLIPHLHSYQYKEIHGLWWIL